MNTLEIKVLGKDFLTFMTHIMEYQTEIDGDLPSHTGIITEVEVIDGKIQKLTMIDSGGRKDGPNGPRYSKVIDNGRKKYWGDRIYGVYKWDTKPDTNNSIPNIITSPIVNKNNSSSNNKSDKGNHFSLTDLWSNLCSKVQSLCSPNF